jgi:4'-phosphopantetheinyl transferase
LTARPSRQSARPESGGGEVTLWWAEPSAAHLALAGLLDPVERAQLRRFQRSRDALLYLTTHLLARAVLGERLGITPSRVWFSRDCRCGDRTHGKPFVPRATVEFSISHTGVRAVVALSEAGRVGVDVERIGVPADQTAMAEIMLTAGELAGWRALPPAARHLGLLRYWTRKEAVLKATGEGLTRPLTEIVVAPPAAAPAVLSGPAPAQLIDIGPRPGYVGAVCVLTQRTLSLVERNGNGILGALQPGGS